MPGSSRSGSARPAGRGSSAPITEARSNLVGAIVTYDAAQVDLLRALGELGTEALLEHP
jgi:hypothetical protein